MCDGRAYELLTRSRAGHFSCVDGGGYPYTVGVHFVFLDGNFYFHCGLGGKKLDCIRANPKVCVNVDELTEIKNRDPNTPCRTGTNYKSVIAFGSARILADETKRLGILREFARKYAGPAAEAPISGGAAAKTAVVEIEVSELSYKER